MWSIRQIWFAIAAYSFAIIAGIFCIVFWDDISILSSLHKKLGVFMLAIITCINLISVCNCFILRAFAVNRCDA